MTLLASLNIVWTSWRVNAKIRILKVLGILWFVFEILKFNYFNVLFANKLFENQKEYKVKYPLILINKGRFHKSLQFSFEKLLSLVLHMIWKNEWMPFNKRWSVFVDEAAIPMILKRNWTNHLLKSKLI